MHNPKIRVLSSSFICDRINASNVRRTIPVAMRSKVLVCGRWITRNAGSNPAEGLDVRHLGVLCVVQGRTSEAGRSLLEDLCITNCA